MPAIRLNPLVILDIHHGYQMLLKKEIVYSHHDAMSDYN